MLAAWESLEFRVTSLEGWCALGKMGGGSFERLQAPDGFWKTNSASSSLLQVYRRLWSSRLEVSRGICALCFNEVRQGMERSLGPSCQGVGIQALEKSLKVRAQSLKRRGVVPPSAEFLIGPHSPGGLLYIVLYQIYESMVIPPYEPESRNGRGTEWDFGACSQARGVKCDGCLWRQIQAGKQKSF